MYFYCTLISLFALLYKHLHCSSWFSLSEYEDSGKLRLPVVCVRRGTGSPKRCRSLHGPLRGDQRQLRGSALRHGLRQRQWRRHERGVWLRLSRSPVSHRCGRHRTAASVHSAESRILTYSFRSKEPCALTLSLPNLPDFCVFTARGRYCTSAE